MISSNASESGAGEKAQTEDDKRGFSLLNSFFNKFTYYTSLLFS